MITQIERAVGMSVPVRPNDSQIVVSVLCVPKLICADMDGTRWVVGA